jgi:hypothetical protein
MRNNLFYHSIHFYPQFWLAEGPANNCVQITVWACAGKIHSIVAANNGLSMRTIDHSQCKTWLSDEDIDSILSLNTSLKTSVNTQKATKNEINRMIKLDNRKISWFCHYILLNLQYLLSNRSLTTADVVLVGKMRQILIRALAVLYFAVTACSPATMWLDETHGNNFNATACRTVSVLSVISISVLLVLRLQTDFQYNLFQQLHAKCNMQHATCTRQLLK